MIYILIPTYNRARFLKECLKELKNQVYTDYQVVVYDDGSTDETEEIVKDFKHIYIKGEKNKGVGLARNELFKYIDSLDHKPEYLIWQDSDDFSHRLRLKYMLMAIQEQQADIVFSDMYFFNHPEKHTRTRTIHKIDVSKYTSRAGLDRNMNFATAIFKTELIKYPFTDKKRREDAQWLSDLIDAGVKFGYLPTALYYCRRHAGRLTYGGKK